MLDNPKHKSALEKFFRISDLWWVSEDQLFCNFGSAFLSLMSGSNAQALMLSLCCTLFSYSVNCKFSHKFSMVLIFADKLFSACIIIIDSIIQFELHTLIQVI